MTTNNHAAQCAAEETFQDHIQDHILVACLALERCQQHLAHLHAILHLCLPEEDGSEERLAMSSLRKLISSMAQELTYSVDTLGLNNRH